MALWQVMHLGAGCVVTLAGTNDERKNAQQAKQGEQYNDFFL